MHLEDTCEVAVWKKNSETNKQKSKVKSSKKTKNKTHLSSRKVLLSGATQFPQPFPQFVSHLSCLEIPRWSAAGALHLPHPLRFLYAPLPAPLSPPLSNQRGAASCPQEKTVIVWSPTVGSWRCDCQGSESLQPSLPQPLLFIDCHLIWLSPAARTLSVGTKQSQSD